MQQLVIIFKEKPSSQVYSMLKAFQWAILNFKKMFLCTYILKDFVILLSKTNKCFDSHLTVFISVQYNIKEVDGDLYVQN